MAAFFKTATKEFPATVTAQDEHAIPLLQPDKWIEEASEGELTVDVYETANAFVVQTTVSGVRPDELSLSVHSDLLTIRGVRTPEPHNEERTYLVEECFWGRFSRSILLPEPIDVSRANSTLRAGVLTITLPKLASQTIIGIEEMTE
ncbi:MAG: Hsp20/alpha crystallin family protein [Candidatus Uhrbacteria bacterium]